MSNSYTRLNSRGALLMQGPDSLSFLQGQVTCDINELNADRSVCGAYCSPQGRMVCDFRIVPAGEESWLLSMQGGLCAEALATFARYIIFSKAELTQASEDWCQMAAWGDGAANALGLVADRENRITSLDGVHWVQTNAAGTCFEAIVRAAHADELSLVLAQQFEEVAEAAYERLEIEAGIGHLAPQTVGLFLPQMLNYQATGRVSFAKGCYTGQEVVARMHYRGKLKNTMHLASAGAESCSPGTALFRDGIDQSIGTVVNAATAENGLLMLAVVRLDALEVEVHLGRHDGPVLEFLGLPYSLESPASG